MFHQQIVDLSPSLTYFISHCANVYTYNEIRTFELVLDIVKTLSKRGFARSKIDSTDLMYRSFVKNGRKNVSMNSDSTGKEEKKRKT